MKPIFLFKFQILIVFVFTSIFTNGQSTGLKNPSNGSNNGPGSSWQGVHNLTSSDDGYVTNNNQGTSKLLFSKGYNFDLASHHVVRGIQVDVERKFVPNTPIAKISAWREEENSRILGYSVPTGTERILMVVLGAENGGTQATYSVSYSGIQMTKATSIVVNTGFTATLEVWYLLNSALPSAASTGDIIVTASNFTPVEYFTSVSAAVFSNVDQVNPFESFVNGTTTSNNSSFQMPSSMLNASGSMAFTAIFCAQNTNPPSTNGATNCWSVNQNFVEQVDKYRANTSCCPNSGASIQIAEKSYSSAATDQPTFTFNGTPNRRCALGVSLRRSSTYDLSVQLLKNHQPVGTNLGLISSAWPTSDSYQTYGGPTNLWGVSWTYSDINHTNFGSMLSSSLGYGVASVDNMRMTVYYSSALPIDLVNFSVANEDDAAILFWTTATEINSSHFEIETSTDGFEFVKIDELPAAGNSISPLNYKYMDHRSKSEVTYYRLKLVDLDGSFTYSEIRSFKTKKTEVTLFPNPAQNWLTYVNTSAIDQAFIIDPNGKIVKTLANFSGEIHQIVDLNDLSEGDYLFVYTENEVKKSLRFKKMN